MEDDSKVRFRYDLWCGDMNLKEVFLVLFGIACTKNASVVTHVEFSGSTIKWNVGFARAVHD